MNKKQFKKRIYFLLIGFFLILYSTICCADNIEKLRELNTLLERLKKEPKNAMLLNLIAYTYEDLGKFEKAIEFYKKAIELEPGRALFRNNIAFTYQKIGKLKEAILELKNALKLAPDDVSYMVNLGKVFEAKAKVSPLNKQPAILEKAKSYYKKALSLDPSFIEAKYCLQSINEKLTKVNNLIKLKEKLKILKEKKKKERERKKKFYTNLVIWAITFIILGGGAGFFLYKKFQYKNLLNEIDNSIKTGRTSKLKNLYFFVKSNNISLPFKIQKSIVQFFIKHRVYTLAKDILLKMREEHPDKFSLDDFNSLANVYILSGDFFKAEKVYYDIFKKFPENTDIVLAGLKKLFEANPDNSSALIAIADSYMNSGMYPSAIELYNKVDEKKFPEVKIKKARAILNTDAYLTVVSTLIEDAIATSNAENITLIIKKFIEQNKFLKGLDLLKKIYQKNPDKKTAHLLIKPASLLFELYSEVPEIVVFLGKLYCNLEKYNKAIELFKSALEINKKDAFLLRNLISLNIKIKNYKEALNLITTFVKEDTTSNELLRLLAELKLKCENFMESLELLRKLQKNTRSIVMDLKIGTVLLKMDKPDIALNLFLEVMFKDTTYFNLIENIIKGGKFTPSATYKKIVSMLEKEFQKFDDEIKTFEESLKQAPNKFSIIKNYTKFLIEAKKFNKAKNILENFLKSTQDSDSELLLIYLKARLYIWDFQNLGEIFNKLKLSKKFSNEILKFQKIFFWADPISFIEEFGFFEKMNISDTTI